ncbi:MAG: bifunctional diguanylate cyclase/phosphodiesterase [Acidimicrobiales bacterium]
MDRSGPDGMAPGANADPGRLTPPPLRRLLALLAGVLLLLGVAASAVAGMAWSGYVRARAAQTFNSMATTAADALSVEMQRDADLAATARALVDTSPALTNAKFEMWFRLLGTRDSYPGSFGLLFLENVRQPRLHAFASQVAADPPIGLPMSGRFAISPLGSKPPYCLTRAGVVDVAPSSGISMGTLMDLLAFTRPDLDYCALPVGALLRESAATGEVAVATLSSLVAEAPHELGVPVVPSSVPRLLAKQGFFATMTPIYSGAMPPKSAALRLESLKGWILGIYQAGGILAPVIQGHHGTSATLSYVNPSGRRTVLARVGPRVASALTKAFPLTSTGKWTVALSAAPPVSGPPPSDQGFAIFLGGSLLSVLVFALVRVLSRSRSKALELVEQRTAQLRHQALHDGLTTLPNRALIFDRAEQMIARARRDHTGLAALFMDIDQFKDVNDTFGHAAGDDLLLQVAQRFRAALRETDTVGRLGGDEFVVLVETVHGAPNPEHVAEILIASLREPFHLGKDKDRVCTVTTSIGIASGPRDSAGELLRDADVALYEAKANAHGSYLVFHQEMQAAIAKRMSLEAELRDAIRNREFFLVYQPIFTLVDQRLMGAEALVRWGHPERGVVMPAEFIPTLEATGMIVELGRFVLEEACQQAAKWAREGYPLNVSVNVSSRQLDREDFVEFVGSVLDFSGFRPEWLTVEITETTLMNNTELSVRRLRALKQIGVNLAIDDFGTGYCSLAYLQQFPIDSLKIDRSFVSRMGSSPEGAALVHTIVQMGRDLNLNTLAEGIETPDQLDRLRLEECESGQGYLFARPLDVPAIEALIAGSRAEATLEKTATQ